MSYSNKSSNIFSALQSFDQALNTHNSTFDDASKIFLEVENKLKPLNSEYWYPYYLSPRFNLVDYSPAPVVPSSFSNEPFDQITYHIGFISKRLVVSKITSRYEYIRDAYGQVLLAPNNAPHMNKVSEIIHDSIIISDSSRAMRVMAIEHLPGFLNHISDSLTTHTNTLTSALNSIKSNW